MKTAIKTSRWVWNDLKGSSFYWSFDAFREDDWLHLNDALLMLENVVFLSIVDMFALLGLSKHPFTALAIDIAL